MYFALVVRGDKFLIAVDNKPTGRSPRSPPCRRPDNARCSTPLNVAHGCSTRRCCGSYSPKSLSRFVLKPPSLPLSQNKMEGWFTSRATISSTSFGPTVVVVKMMPAGRVHPGRKGRVRRTNPETPRPADNATCARRSCSCPSSSRCRAAARPRSSSGRNPARRNGGRTPFRITRWPLR